MVSPRLRARTDARVSGSGHPLRGETAAFATMHDKLVLVRPLFEDGLGMNVDVAAIDTDRFGSFAGEIPREGTAADTAIRKARSGAEALGLRFGIASEGSIGPSPHLPFVNADVETMAFVDLESGSTIVEHAVSHEITTIFLRVAPGDDIDDRLVRGGFPGHGVIVRSAAGPSRLVVKGLHTYRGVHDAVFECADASTDGRVIIETDFRANHCPSRRPTIAAAAQRLVDRLQVLCRRCGSPGWGVVDRQFGAPCRSCGITIDVPVRDVFGCGVCGGRRPADEVLIESVDPARCPSCNP